MTDNLQGLSPAPSPRTQPNSRTTPAATPLSVERPMSLKEAGAVSLGEPAVQLNRAESNRLNKLMVQSDAAYTQAEAAMQMFETASLPGVDSCTLTTWDAGFTFVGFERRRGVST